MFVPDFNKSIPGYTGHRQTALDEAEDVQQHKDPRKQIPGKYTKIWSLKPFTGYGGYVPGVKSENVYGQTYGKTSYASSAKSFVRGMEEPAHLKYNTSMKMEFVDHAQRSHLIETTAQIVGVERGDSVYQKVSYNLIISHHLFCCLANPSFSSSCILRIRGSRRRQGRGDELYKGSNWVQGYVRSQWQCCPIAGWRQGLQCLLRHWREEVWQDCVATRWANPRLQRSE